MTISVVNRVPKPQTSLKATKGKGDLLRQYPDRFQGLGRFPREAKLELKPNAEPVVHAAPRRCPIHLKGEIQRALNEMEKQEIISKIPAGQPTEWLSSLGYARKSNGKLRVCLDPRDLNANLKRTYHRTTIQDITHKLAGARVFSKLDALSLMRNPVC